MHPVGRAYEPASGNTPKGIEHDLDHVAVPAICRPMPANPNLGEAVVRQHLVAAIGEIASTVGGLHDDQARHRSAAVEVGDTTVGHNQHAVGIEAEHIGVKAIAGVQSEPPACNHEPPPSSRRPLDRAIDVVVMGVHPCENPGQALDVGKRRP